MAETLRLRQIDDADGALQTTAAELRDGLRLVAEHDHEAVQSGAVQDRLVAVRQPGAHPLPFGGSVPRGGGGDSPLMGREPYREGLGSKLLPDELPEVQLPGRAHV